MMSSSSRMAAASLFAALTACTAAVQAPSPPGTSPVPSVAVASVDRVAVHVGNATSAAVPDAVLRATEDEFSRALVAKGYQVTARGDVDRALASEGVEDRASTKFARLEQALMRQAGALDISRILLVSITAIDTRQYRPVYGSTPLASYQARASLRARLVEVAQGQLVWTESREATMDVTDIKYGMSLLPVVANALAERMPRRGSPRR